jgi:glutamate-1-semialdehyde 2,1-aminomutase
MGLVLPQSGFLENLRNLTSKKDILLIFDEVITGFRVSYGGAQGIYGINPDLTCLGKIIGGGFPVGAYGGRKDIMQMLAPLGPVYQAGTLSGNPVVMTAGIETLAILKKSGFYEELEKRASLLTKNIAEAAGKVGAVIQQPYISSMFTIFFTEEQVVDYESALKSDTKRYAKFFHNMLNSGIYLPPSQFETAFISAAHTDKDIQATVDAATEAFTSL